MKKLQSEILAINKKTEDISEFILWIPEDFDFKNWQFLTIDIPQEKIIKTDWKTIIKNIFIKRAYSIVEIQNNKIVLWIKNVNWKWTTYLFSRKIWDKLNISWSFWHFFVKWEEENLCFMATWIWIPPIISQLKYCFEDKKEEYKNKKIFLAYWIRKKSDLFFEEILKKFSDENKNFSYKIFFSREDEKFFSEKNNFWNYKKWYFTQIFEDKNFIDFKNSEFYFCGSLPLMKEIWEKLEEKQVEKDRFIFEAY